MLNMNWYNIWTILWQILVTFLAMTGVEFMWALYIHNLRDNEEFIAGVCSALIVVLGGFATILFMKNYWMLIPAGLGAFTGTYISKYFYTKK